MKNLREWGKGEKYKNAFNDQTKIGKLFSFTSNKQACFAFMFITMLRFHFITFFMPLKFLFPFLIHRGALESKKVMANRFYLYFRIFCHF